MKLEQVILVTEEDAEVGLMEKMEAHQKGLLHRAFSVFLTNDRGELLLQQRAFSKYHSGGLWTNACCSHPRPGETVVQAAERRLVEELGISTEIKPIFSFVYKANLDNNLTEHELDHVLVGKFNGELQPNPDEVESYRYISPVDLKMELATNPDNFTVWFKLVYNRVQQYLKESS